MIEHERTLNNIKSELLTLYVDASKEYKSFNAYFRIFQQSVFKFFDIENIHFYIVRNHLLKPTDPSVNEEFFRNGIEWAKFEYYFNEKNIVPIPETFINSEPFSQFDQMMVIRKNNNEPFGVMYFESTPSWHSFANSTYIHEFLVVVSKLFLMMYESIEIRLNEIHYRKLYNMTDLFYSTMDTDVILENVILAIEENFPEFHVELILSNDQDRHTKIRIKQFDYLSERPSTIEAFVSGELTVEIAEELHTKLLNAPIKGRQAIYGILQVHSPIDTIYTEAQKNYIRMLAQASGNALENAKLYHQSHRLIADLQMINETSHRLNLNLTIDEMLSYLQKQLIKSFQPMELGFVFIEETYEITNTVTKMLLTDVGELYLNYAENHFNHSQDSLFIADFSRLIGEEVQFKSMMAIPLLIGNKIIGYCIVLHEQPYFFSFDSFKLMQSLIQHSSLAISNSILRDRLQTMADRDHLTKLYARRFLDRFVENALQQDEDGMFLLIDIDNFKKINDNYGHQIGDEVLVQIANQLKSLIGTRGICARWGGEEIAVCVSNLLEDESLKIANQIVELIPFVTNPKVTISAGLVPWKRGNKPKFQEIFLQADTALYVAKNKGKNQFCVFNEAMHLHF